MKAIKNKKTRYDTGSITFMISICIMAFGFITGAIWQVMIAYFSGMGTVYYMFKLEDLEKIKNILKKKE